MDHILSLKIPNMDLSPAPFQSLLPISKLCSSEHCPWAPDARPGGIRLRLRGWNGHLSSLSYPNPAHRRGGSSQRHVSGGCREDVTSYSLSGSALEMEGVLTHQQRLSAWLWGSATSLMPIGRPPSYCSFSWRESRRGRGGCGQWQRQWGTALHTALGLVDGQQVPNRNVGSRTPQHSLWLASWQPVTSSYLHVCPAA